MKRFLAILLGCSSAIPICAQSRFSYSTALSGTNERPLPATPSLATGQARMTLDILPAFTTVTWDIRWTSLSGLPIAAHFHGPAGPETPAPVLFSLGNFFSDSTPNSGGYSGFRQLTDPMQISAIRDGMAYVNIPTESYPDGEIRGQLQMVPEPSTLALIGFVAVAMRLITPARSVS